MGESYLFADVTLVGLRFSAGSRSDLGRLLGIISLNNVTVDQELYSLYADAFQAFDAMDGKSVTVVPNPFGNRCEFDSYGICGVGDIDMLMNVGSVDRGVPVDANGNEVFDLNRSGVIDGKDVSLWLSVAPTENGLTEPFKLDDTNLDGHVESKTSIWWDRLGWPTATPGVLATSTATAW